MGILLPFPLVIIHLSNDSKLQFHFTISLVINVPVFSDSVRALLASDAILSNEAALGNRIHPVDVNFSCLQT